MFFIYINYFIQDPKKYLFFENIKYHPKHQLLFRHFKFPLNIFIIPYAKWHPFFTFPLNIFIIPYAK